MGSLVSLRWVLAVGGVAVAIGVAASACSASPPEDPESEEFGGKPDGSPGIKLPGSEKCGNGIDDNDNGVVDEGCGACGTGGKSSTEVPGATNCGTGGSGNSGGGGSVGGGGGSPGDCVPKGTTESNCNDASDDDCDGQIDCDDPECRHPGQCGCQPKELNCGDGTDDDCDTKQDCADEDCGGKCVPGSMRWCDEPVYCAWGQQTCGPDGNWGACVEVPAPSGCEGFFGFDNTYDLDCCLAQGFCCQAYPQNHSVGNCAGINLCG